MNPRKTARRRRIATTRGSGFEHVDWQLALAMYEAERLQEAYETALDSGMGQVGQYLDSFRMIEAEYLTSSRSETKRIQPFLELEWVRDELEGNEDFVATVALEAFQEVGNRFGYAHESAVRLTVLAEETNAPWLYGRYGFCVSKTPYYKICIPLNIVQNPRQLFNTLRHEYAHVVVGTLAKNRAPRWLDEAVAMLAEGGVSEQHTKPFRNNQAHWLSIQELEAEIRDPRETQDRWLAYVQSGIVGMYLAENFGEPKIGEFLRSFLQGWTLADIWDRATGKGIEEGPIRRTFGLSSKKLFENAYARLRSQ